MRTCPLVRADAAGSSGGRGWIVSRLSELVGVRVDDLTIAILARAASPCRRDELISSWNEDLAESIEKRLDGLAALGYLETECSHLALAEEVRRWGREGWVAAADYHFHTFGYPFERYDETGASNEDARRMLAFAEASRDVDRGKSYPHHSRVAVPSPAPEQLAVSPAALLAHEAPRHPVDASRLGLLVSWTGGSTGETRLPWPGAAPVMRRTSPSGGSRHPTELYLLNFGVSGLPLGWSHLNSRTSELELLTEAVPSHDQVVELFSGLVAHADFKIEAVLVLTCVFARNRYRYREPRTFRTVHLDVGHLLTTAEVVASGLGMAATSLNAVNSAQLAATLKLDPLTEAPMGALLVGTHHEPTKSGTT